MKETMHKAAETEQAAVETTVAPTAGSHVTVLGTPVTFYTFISSSATSTRIRISWLTDGGTFKKSIVQKKHWPVVK